MTSPMLRFSVAALLVAPACGRPPIAPSPPPGLDAAVQQQAGPAQPIVPIAFGVTYDEDESVTTQVNLEMGRCYTFAAAGDPATVEEVKIYLFNPNGQRVLDNEDGHRTTASFCVTGQMVVNIKPMGWGSSVAMAIPGPYKLEVKTTEGYGHFAYGAFVQGDTAGASPAAEPPPAPPEAPADTAPPQE